MYICMYLCVCMCVCVCVFVCTCIHTKRILERGRYSCNKWYQKYSKHQYRKRGKNIEKIEICENIN
jgi:hypothetical protein